MIVVIDASVAIKWYVQEVHSEAARRFQADGLKLHAPDLIYPEVGNILWKKTRRGEISDDESRDVARAVLAIPFSVHPSAALLAPALEIALSTGRTAYDSLYLALAVALDAPLVTADQRLRNAIASGPLSAHNAWVEDPL